MKKKTMLDLLTRSLLVFGLLVGGTALTACQEKDGPVEELGEDIDEAVDEAGDALEEAADEVEDAVDGE